MRLPTPEFGCRQYQGSTGSGGRARPLSERARRRPAGRWAAGVTGGARGAPRALGPRAARTMGARVRPPARARGGRIAPAARGVQKPGPAPRGPRPPSVPRPHFGRWAAGGPHHAAGWRARRAKHMPRGGARRPRTPAGSFPSCRAKYRPPRGLAPNRKSKSPGAGRASARRAADRARAGPTAQNHQRRRGSVVARTKEAPERGGGNGRRRGWGTLCASQRLPSGGRPRRRQPSAAPFRDRHRLRTPEAGAPLRHPPSPAAARAVARAAAGRCRHGRTNFREGGDAVVSQRWYTNPAIRRRAAHECVCRLAGTRVGWGGIA